MPMRAEIVWAKSGSCFVASIHAGSWERLLSGEPSGMWSFGAMRESMRPARIFAAGCCTPEASPGLDATTQASLGRRFMT